MVREVSILVFFLLYSAYSAFANECIPRSPQLKLDPRQFDGNAILSRGSDFIDLKVGSNLTLSCEGLVAAYEQNATTKQKIEWILPEFHPVSVLLCITTMVTCSRVLAI